MIPFAQRAPSLGPKRQPLVFHLCFLPIGMASIENRGRISSVQPPKPQSAERGVRKRSDAHEETREAGWRKTGWTERLNERSHIVSLHTICLVSKLPLQAKSSLVRSTFV